MISFPRLECWNPTNQVVTVAADVDKSRILCRVSMQILSDQFGASRDEPMQFVLQHRTAIQDVARALIENKMFEKDGSVLIRACDFPKSLSGSETDQL